MATEAFQRALRRLRQHRDATDQPVGARLAGGRIVLWQQWDDGRGRLNVLEISPPLRCWLNLDKTRQLARAVYGPAWVDCLELADPDSHCVHYVQELDRAHDPLAGPGSQRPPAPLVVRIPAWIRWYQARSLCAGLGDQDSGAFSTAGRHVVFE